jgi:transposase
VRVIDVFVDELDLLSLGFDGVVPEATGRPSYHPAVLLKLYIYGYLNQVSSSRGLERGAQRNVEVMWLTGRLAPDFKTIADFRRDNGPAIRATCRQFIALCRQLDLFAEAIVAIDGSRFKAVNTRDKNFTRASIKRRMEQVEASIDRYLSALATADRHDSEIAQQKSVRLKDKLASLREQMRAFKALEVRSTRRPISRSRSPIPMPAPWPPTARARGWSATTFRPPLIPCRARSSATPELCRPGRGKR